MMIVWIAHTLTERDKQTLFIVCGRLHSIHKRSLLNWLDYALRTKLASRAPPNPASLLLVCLSASVASSKLISIA